MISLILPYWQRQAAADAALSLLAKHYADLSLEVIVVDDGSPIPFRAPESMPFALRVIRLQQKNDPKDPCVPVNAGANAAAGDYLALSCIEILHVNPVLPAMLEQCMNGDENTYVLAAVWAPESNRWHVHSSLADGRPAARTNIRMPIGAHYNFMAMMSRSLWDHSGGFDDDYRSGAGYGDADYILRLQRAGAHFHIRDDLVVHHPRAGAHAKWTPEMFERNRKLYISKWAPS